MPAKPKTRVSVTVVTVVAVVPPVPVVAAVGGALALCALLACQRRVDEPRSSAPAPLASATPAVLPAPPVSPLLSAVSAAQPVSPTPGGSALLAAASAAFVPKPGGFRFAVIGDFGVANAAERGVAELVKAFHPEIVITVGDNNYPLGGADTIDQNIGQFYSEFIAPYAGSYGKGAAENRFFPALGNHDFYTDNAKAYFDYFTLPGNERYYTFSRGPVDFFALDSDPNEPDGIEPTSQQALWLKSEAAKARGAWQIAYMHHPPYSSGPHGSTPEAQWPYREWGIDLVLAGHDHTYERAVVGGVTFLVNGLGGNDEYRFKAPIPNSLFRYNAKHGAQLAVATASELDITFVNVDNTRIDEVILRHEK